MSWVDRSSWIEWENNYNDDNTLHINNSIINVILKRQLSVHAIHNAKLYYNEMRIKNLHLSTYYEIKSGHDSVPAISLALEKQEERYLLSGGADGLIALYDLDTYKTNNDNNTIQQAQRIESMNKTRVHTRGVSSIQWYPEDSGIFISSSFDGQVLIWDTNAFSTAATFKFHAEGSTNFLKVYSAAMCSNGNPLIACALDDSSIRLCDPRSGDCCQSLTGHRKAVMSVAWSPLHSHLVASASLDGTLKLWDIRKAGFASAIRSFDWMQDHTASTRIFTDFYNKNKERGENPKIRIKEPIKGAMTGLDWTKDSVAKAHEAGIMCLRFTPCGHYTISSGNDRKIRLWDADSGRLIPSQFSSGCISTLPYDLEIAQFSCSGDDVLIFPNGNDGNITLTQLHSSTGHPFLTLKGHLGMVNSIIYRRTHQQIISSAADGLIFIWDTDVNSSMNKFRKGSSAATNSKVFTHDEVEVESDWSGEGEDEDDRYRKCFVPPIIQQYLDDARTTNDTRTTTASSSSSSSTVLSVSTRITSLFPRELESMQTQIPNSALDDRSHQPERSKATRFTKFKKINYKKT